ncbi:MAG: PAS domain S-box protein, partial [Desulfobacteraceae bacterium]|nr:PAS domain S-box protein [Desulfobacteraceae bacterium]
MILKFKEFLQNRLALKILIYILLFGSVLSLSTTFVQLYLDSKKNLKEVRKSITIIKETRLEPISLSLYNYNVSQLEIQLESLLNLKGIEQLKITEKGGFEKIVGTLNKTGERIIKEEIDLQYIDASKRVTTLGKLEITAKLHNPYHRIYKKLPVLLITNSIKALITAILIFGIIQYLITRHLSFIANYASNVSMEKLDTPLSLKRKPLFFIKEDELDQLIYAINSMRLRLKKDIEKQSEYEKKLLRSEERLRQLVNASRDAIVIHEKGMLVFANDQYYSMLGYKPDELTGVNILSKTMTPESVVLINKMISLEQFGNYEVTAQKKDKTTFPAELNSTGMEFHG